jgi:hypothetical protein
MANEFDDLISQFGSGGKTKQETLPSTQFDDLIKQFGTGKYEIAPVKSQEIGPPRPEEAANYKPTEYEGRSIARGIKNLPGNILKNVAEDF